MLQLTYERRAQGLSQARLGRRARVDPATMSKIESRRLLPYPRQLARIAKALRVPLEFAPRLLDEIDRPRATVPDVIPSLSVKVVPGMKVDTGKSQRALVEDDHGPA